MHELWLVYAIVGLALAFDFINGFHDAANSIATVVSTRVLSPGWAVVWAAVFNFIAFLFFSLGVARTIGKGTVDHTQVSVAVVAAGLVGAITWNLLTWYYGIPSSSSHALVGGFAGAAVAKAGWGVLIPGSFVTGLLKHGVFNPKNVGLVDIGIFIFIAPIVGLVVGFVLMVVTYWVFRRASPNRVSGLFRKLQLLSAAAYSLGHGGNDAQKTMGIILVVLIAARRLDAKAEIPLWVVLSCHAAMGLGTLMGGWRIVKTMGQKICQLQPVHGFCAETAGALTLFAATELKIPVSTTHTITGSIVGVGSTRGIHAVKWGVAGRVVWAWILTIPVSAGIAAALYYPMGWLIKF